MSAAARSTRFLGVEETSSALTDRYQTTVPTPVRKALGLAKGDRIRYRFVKGEVLLQKVEPAAKGDDPALEPFLELIAHDVERHPARLRGIDAALIARARKLTSGVIVDRDAPLDPEDE